MDPLSRLLRAPPEHTSPNDEAGPTLESAAAKDELIPSVKDSEPARRATFIAYTLDDCLEGCASVWAVTRAKTRETQGGTEPANEKEDASEAARTQEGKERRRTQVTEESFLLWEASNPPPNMHIHLEQETLERFIAGYQKDESFKRKWTETEFPAKEWNPGNRFYKDSSSLLFFRDADYQPRLCVPKSEQAALLKEAHDQPYGGGAHWTRALVANLELQILLAENEIRRSALLSLVRRVPEDQTFKLQEIWVTDSEPDPGSTLRLYFDGFHRQSSLVRGIQRDISHSRQINKARAIHTDDHGIGC